MSQKVCHCSDSTHESVIDGSCECCGARKRQPCHHDPTTGKAWTKRAMLAWKEKLKKEMSFNKALRAVDIVLGTLNDLHHVNMTQHRDCESHRVLREEAARRLVAMASGG
jgi:hypothetical protein